MMTVNTISELYERVSLPLPYYDYSENDKIYHLSDGGCAIMFKCQPQYGGKDVESGLRSMYSSLPEGAFIQIILWANPNVTSIVDKWKSKKKIKIGLYGEIIDSIGSFFDGSDEKSIKTHNYNLYITVKLGGKSEPQTIFSFQKMDLLHSYKKNYNLLKDTYKRIEGALKAAKLNPVDGNPDELIEFVYTCLNQNHDFRQIPKWDGSACISDFCVANDTAISVTDTHIIADGVYGKSLSTKDYPSEWALIMSDVFTGKVFGGMSFETPLLLSLNLVKCEKKQYSTIKRNAQVVLSQRLPQSLFPRLRFKQDDLAYANVKLAQGEPLYLVNFSLFAFAEDMAKLDAVVGQIKSYYQSHLFKLEEDLYINHASLLAMLPFNWDDEINRLLRRGRTVFIDSAIDLSPVSADYYGHYPGEMMFVTPRGQLYGFNLFHDEAGGFNAFVIGTTGAGKSVAMQYMSINYLLSSARVYILDIGGSYKRFCNAFDGEYIEITPDNPICLNPWTDIVNDQMFQEFQPFLADWYYMMGAPLDKQMSDQLEKLIKSTLNQALEQSYHNYGNNSCVDTLIKELETLNSAEKDSRINDFVKTLLPYSSQGLHSKFFNGASEINFHSRLVVLENGKMENIPELRDPIIMILTYHISKHIYINEDISSKHLVIIDEAHKFLGNPKIDIFVEQAYRRFRKSGASMIVGTQGFEDLYDGENTTRAGRVIVQNSAYKIFMLQSGVSRQKMKQSNLFSLNSYYEEMLDSVMPVENVYSEMMIISEKEKIKVRLILPELLKALFFTSKEVRMQIEELVKGGMSYVEAVKSIANQRGSL